MTTQTPSLAGRSARSNQSLPSVTATDERILGMSSLNGSIGAISQATSPSRRVSRSSSLDSTAQPVRVAVIGSGLAGLSTAFILSTQTPRRDDPAAAPPFLVTLYEKAPAPGMDSASVSVKCFCRKCSGNKSSKVEHVEGRIEVPQRAFSPDWYPTLVAFYRYLGIPFDMRDDTPSVSINRLGQEAATSAPIPLVNNSADASAAQRTIRPHSQIPPQSRIARPMPPKRHTTSAVPVSSSSSRLPPATFVPASDSDLPPMASNGIPVVPVTLLSASPSLLPSDDSDTDSVVSATSPTTFSDADDSASFDTALQSPPSLSASASATAPLRTRSRSSLAASSSSSLPAPVGTKAKPDVVTLWTGAQLRVSAKRVLALPFPSISLPPTLSAWLSLLSPYGLFTSITSLAWRARLLVEFYALQRDGTGLRRSGELKKLTGTVEEWFIKRGGSKDLREGFLYPMMSSVCTCRIEDIRDYPAKAILDWLSPRHSLFHPQGPLLRGPGLRTHFLSCPVSEVCARLLSPVHRVALGTGVRRVRRSAEGGWIVEDERGGVAAYDVLVVATQANQVAGLLDLSYPGPASSPPIGSPRRTAPTSHRHINSVYAGNSAPVSGAPPVPANAGTTLQSMLDLLSTVKYVRSISVVHSDPRLMPPEKKDWRTFNYFINEGASNGDASGLTTKSVGPVATARPMRPEDGATVTHLCNATMEGLGMDVPYFQTWNPIIAPLPHLTHSASNFDRAVPTPASSRAMDQLDVLQGTANLYLVGSYVWPGVPLLEGCVRSAMRASRRMGKRFGREVVVPWVRDEEWEPVEGGETLSDRYFDGYYHLMGVGSVEERGML
ncbi:hypothetical protein M427DRAFT_178922 [Gonapodya prolifera JEL478]|uniref:FAD/NAD(P)-binding domain-containing protein n=1 Tax=Gonapodya prolifera (strain JEL478) TaxID=1344416 RepID=A0A139AQ54_GONPJ|nr:hypothetical protein M427DRAFT_178922 [Gonapodya prolifera JEL478]|eukprot:KXS18891.1 hypothetical protein M427DRAFT_178922 [Gonapodya prolifera JEL478]